MKLPVRQPVAGGSVRQPQPIAVVVLARLLGVAMLVGAGAAMYWLTTADRFRVDPQTVPISGLSYTDEQLVRERAGLATDARTNVFRVRAQALAEAIRALPSVESAEVLVALPDRLEISVKERQPLLVWRTDAGAFLADISGALIAAAPADLAASLPQVDDRRTTGSTLAVGGRLDEVDMAAARLLLTITPADLGSRSAGLALSVDDEDGFALESAVPAWRAVFGFYTANQLRPDERVPRQKQCLTSMLATGEDRFETVYLAVAGDTCGTYREHPTPSARFFQNVGRPGA